MALVAQASQRRAYAMAAEESNKGVVSIFQHLGITSTSAYADYLGSERFLPSGQYRKLY